MQISQRSLLSIIIKPAKFKMMFSNKISNLKNIEINILKKRICRNFFIRACQILILFFYAFLTTNTGLCDNFIKKQETKVKLLKYPYPYSAALTIASDTHQVNLAVENFEAIHVLMVLLRISWRKPDIFLM